ncbi:hypothetical protein BROUX41_006684 [Berkeleyomyces rouxiae]|uniref:uncharacterized protein n=1 Tax=Berkeleyomyces rouxiae TaxID=2035830 RepID=UPI003B775D20
MSSSTRFTSQGAKVSNDRLSTQTVGLVHLSEFRKRRTEVIEAQEREARELLLDGGKSSAESPQTLDALVASASENSTPNAHDNSKPKKKRNAKKIKLSFDNDDDQDEENDHRPALSKKPKTTQPSESATTTAKDSSTSSTAAKSNNLSANNSVLVPRIVTKTSQKREAAERDELRREFLALQDSIKNTEIVIPFVFYDGTNLPGGVVRVRKGDYSWVFLDKSRKVGAALAAGARTTSRKDWARVGVDDLILVRGTVIIPHHYDFYYFIMNKTTGPGQVKLFDFSTEAPPKQTPSTLGDVNDADAATGEDSTTSATTSSSVALKASAKKALPDISTLEGATDDPFFTKVVDRRWYERNKHIYPASTWQEYDAEKDYSLDIKRDTGGNAFFYS